MTTETYDPTQSINSVIDLTEPAIEHFGRVATDKYVKFGIIGGGCSGFQYHWEIYDEPQDHFDGDEIVNYGIFTLVIDSYSVPYLAGALVDYITDVTGSRIEINNPNAVGGCGCGESVQF